MGLVNPPRKVLLSTLLSNDLARLDDVAPHVGHTSNILSYLRKKKNP